LKTAGSGHRKTGLAQLPNIRNQQLCAFSASGAPGDRSMAPEFLCCPIYMINRDLAAGAAQFFPPTISEFDTYSAIRRNEKRG